MSETRPIKNTISAIDLIRGGSTLVVALSFNRFMERMIARVVPESAADDRRIQSIAALIQLVSVFLIILMIIMIFNYINTPIGIEKGFLGDVHDNVYLRNELAPVS